MWMDSLYLHQILTHKLLNYQAQQVLFDFLQDFNHPTKHELRLKKEEVDKNSKWLGSQVMVHKFKMILVSRSRSFQTKRQNEDQNTCFKQHMGTLWTNKTSNNGQEDLAETKWNQDQEWSRSSLPIFFSLKTHQRLNKAI